MAEDARPQAASRLIIRGDEHLRPHPLKGIGHADEGPGYRHRLPDVTGDRDRDQVEAAETAVGRIEGDPARTGNEAVLLRFEQRKSDYVRLSRLLLPNTGGSCRVR